MKLLAILYLTLFSFTYDETYKVENYSCENNQIQIQYEENWYDFELFNVLLNDDTNVCPYLEGKIEIEFENQAKIAQPLSGYLFVNEKLLQTRLIEEDKAVVKIANPNYKYQFDENEEMVMADENIKKDNKQTSKSRDTALMLIVVYILICLAIIIVVLKRKALRDTKKDENDV